MNVIINGRFLVHKVTGVERYARELLAELDKLIKPGELTLAVPPEVNELPPYKNIKAVSVGRLHNRLWEHISFPRYVARQKGVSLNLCNVAPLPDPGIVCIHDMRIKAVPQTFSRKFRLWYALLFANETRRAKKLLTVSEFSKREIMKYYSVEEDRIGVIPSAWQHYLRTGYDEGAFEKYGVEKDKYYFSMCSLEPNKNFKWIAEVARRNPGQLFAVAGSVNETVFANGLGFECPANMKLLGYVSDEEAKTLMRDCKAFLFPTYYEGFGLPPLEAMSAGAKSVVVSDTEVMHEVYGEGVIYINPDSYDYDLDLLVSRGGIADREPLQRFGWEKSAKKLYEIIKS